MKPEEFSNALNHLDEKLLQEAEEARKQKARRRPAWKKWGTLAACLALAVFAGTRLLPSGPVAGSELPSITIQNDGTGSFGYEGYMALDISELGGANPWTESCKITALPVYKNPITYDEQYRAVGADPDKMKALLLAVAEGVGLDTKLIPIIDNTPSEDYIKAVTEKMAAVGEKVPEGYFDPTTVIIEGNGIKVEVDQTLTARIDFDPEVELPSEYNFSYSASSEEMKEAADWLSKEYSGLLSGMKNPVLDQGMADRNIYRERSFETTFYDGSGSLAEQIVNYNFNRVTFYNNDEGKLFIIRVFSPDLSQKMGDYPIISAKDAEKLLFEGNYASSVPYEITEGDTVAKVELVYRTSAYEQVWLPYYRFLVELPEEFRPEDKELHDFGAFYVPAVEGKYITNMPTYDGRFN